MTKKTYISPNIGKPAGRTPTDIPTGMMSTHLAAQQFKEHTEKHGGATMNVHTGKILQPGESGIVVGGEPSKTGKRVETGYVGNDKLDTAKVMHQWARVKDATSGANVNLGSWKDAGNTEFDASSVVHDRRQAVSLGRSRAEKAVWDNARGQEIDTSSADSAARVASDLKK